MTARTPNQEQVNFTSFKTGKILDMSARAVSISRIRPSIKRRQNALAISLIGMRSSLSLTRGKVNSSHAKKINQPMATFPFLRLPRDIRDMIYTDLFDLYMPSQLVVRDPRGLVRYVVPFVEDLFPRLLPGLCYASRQLYQETAPLILANKEIVLQDSMAIKVLSDFLKLPSNQLIADGVRTLTFASTINWRPWATHIVQNLLRKCPRLQNIGIEVMASSCVDATRIRSKSEIVQELDLCCLLDCESLKTLTVHCTGGGAVAARLDSTRELVFKPVVLWLRQNVCGNGMVRLIVEYADRQPEAS